MIARVKSAVDWHQFHHGTTHQVASFLNNSRSRRRRTISQFAEQEIILPTGPREGRKFRIDTQPWTRLWFDEWESGNWYEFCATGPSQSVKSLVC